MLPEEAYAILVMMRRLGESFHNLIEEINAAGYDENDMNEAWHDIGTRLTLDRLRDAIHTLDKLAGEIQRKEGR